MQQHEKALSFAAREVLTHARVEGTIIYLPEGQLARPLYQEVNDALERMGGAWNRKAKGHVFAHDPTEQLAVLIQTGLMPPKNPLAFYATPPAVIERMIDTLNNAREVHRGMSFLEPSAGKGAIALALRDWLAQSGIFPDVILHTCELDPTLATFLASEGLSVIALDFLSYTPTSPYDVIVMNPPFAVEGDANAYITHIMHAYEMLAEGGVLVAIAPPGYTFHKDKASCALLALVEACGAWETLPEDSFKASGTGVNTTLLHLIKPGVPQESAPPAIDAPVRAIVTPISPDLDSAHALLQEIEAMERKRKQATAIPVFGDATWIARRGGKR